MGRYGEQEVLTSLVQKKHLVDTKRSSLTGPVGEFTGGNGKAQRGGTKGFNGPSWQKGHRGRSQFTLPQALFQHSVKGGGGGMSFFLES